MNHAYRQVLEADVREFYEPDGYRVMYPDDIEQLATADLRHLTLGATAILDQTYNRNRQLTKERAVALEAGIQAGTLHLFAVIDPHGEVVAITQLKEDNSRYTAEAEVVVYEAGGTAKWPSAPESFKAFMLLAGRYSWAHANLHGKVDYLSMQTRVAAPTPGRPWTGNVLGRALRLASLLPAHAGYFNMVGPRAAEPFMYLATPLDFAAWAEQVERQVLHAPDALVAADLSHILAESTEQALHPNISACPTDSQKILAKMHEVSEPSPTVESLYVTTHLPVPPELPLVPRVPGKALDRSGGLSDRVVIEHDAVSGNQGARRAYQDLYEQGFVVSGWTPSVQKFGRLAVVLNRPGGISPDSVAVTAQLAPEMQATSPTANRFFAGILARQPRQTM